ncbi:MAG: LysM domain-containing protein [Chloroflexota bacterium]
MEGPSTTGNRRTITPAVLASALFAAACALIAISFVAARGGLQMPVAGADASAGAPRNSQAATLPTALISPAPSAAATVAPVSTPPSSIPPPSAGPSSQPTSQPTPRETTAPWESVAPGDPLLALPRCPDQPGCFVYQVRRGDTLSGVASRYAIPVTTVVALNPQLSDPGTIVVGDPLYLGRSPFLRLERCPGDAPCWLYTVAPGDRLSTIGGRFGLGVQAILDANPAITDPNAIYSGQVIRLPEPA